MPMPTTQRRSLTRYRRPIWIPGEALRIEREIPISTKRWFARTEHAGVTTWTFTGLADAPIVIGHGGSRSNWRSPWSESTGRMGHTFTRSSTRAREF